MNFYLKALSFSSLPTSYPAPDSEWRAIYKTLSRDKFTNWHKRIVPEAALPLQVYYSIFNSYCICCRMLFTGQDCIYRTLKSPEVQSIASLLKISSMQCNIWCAEFFFQKAKNDLGLFNWGGNMIFIGLYTKWILVLCSLHSSWLASNEKLYVLSVTLKKIRWQ